MPIRRLPELLVNQIAAGEVIERPASVVKEAIENAIDATATRLDIAVENGGKDLVRVSDDGCGIPLEELELAVAPHATSKLATAEDLDAIATMGFRGEALASIASVSRLSLVSRTRDQDAAALIEAEGSQVGPPRPTGGPVGTTLTVRNLFFNTPARRKFLRTEQTEATRVREVVESLALAHPTIGFTLRSDDRLVLELPPGQTARQRAVAVLGTELEPELLEVRADEAGLRLWGLVGRPAIARGTSRHLRLFVNGRGVADRSLMHAVREAFRGLVEPNRHPTAAIFLQVDPAEVDVNVHPAKAEVRFRHQARVHGLVLNAVRRALQQADLMPSFELGPASGPSSLGRPSAGHQEFGPGFRSDAPRPDVTAVRQFVDYFRRLDPTQKGFVYGEVKQALAADEPELLARDVTDAPDQEAAEPDALPRVRTVAGAMQVHSSYIVTQDEQGLVIIDQHALHERVMFEKLKQRLTDGDLESQRLLIPATIDVERRQMEHLEQLQPLFARLGITAEPIGPASVAVHAFTSLLFERNVEPDVFMAELLDKAASGALPADHESALHEVLDMMACKAAVKAGDRLSDEEIDELLRFRDRVDRASNCPHGRPTSLRLTIRDLDRQFGRS